MSETYFHQLARLASSLLDRLPIEEEVQPLEYAVTRLSGVLEERRETEVETMRTLWGLYSRKEQKNQTCTGLNTLGMLADRFTILLIREWCLRNKYEDQAKADELFLNQTSDIIRALAEVRTGKAGLHTKITRLSAEVSVADWEEAFYRLLAVNLVLWESQEVLYIKDISMLPETELRAYIQWFARGNVERNALMEWAEIRFREKVGLT